MVRRNRCPGASVAVCGNKIETPLAVGAVAPAEWSPAATENVALSPGLIGRDPACAPSMNNSNSADPWHDTASSRKTISALRAGPVRSPPHDLHDFYIEECTRLRAAYHRRKG